MSERLHCLGAYIIRMERTGNAFLFDLFKNGAIFASGYDMRSPNEEAAVAGIVERFGIAEASKQFFKETVCQHH